MSPGVNLYGYAIVYQALSSSEILQGMGYIKRFPLTSAAFINPSTGVFPIVAFPTLFRAKTVSRFNYFRAKMAFVYIINETQAFILVITYLAENIFKHVTSYSLK